MHDVRSIIAKCETMQISSLNATELNTRTLGRLWDALSQFVLRQLTSGRAANIPQFGRFGHNPRGGVTFTLSPAFMSLHRVRSNKPITVQERSTDVSWAGLALAAGVNKDAARVGLREILQKFGHYAGALRQSARLTFTGVGTVTVSGGTLSFSSQASTRVARGRTLAASRSVPVLAMAAPSAPSARGVPSPLAATGQMVAHKSARYSARSRRTARGSTRGRSAAGAGAGAGPAAMTKTWGASPAAIERAGVDPKLLSSYNRRSMGVPKPVSQKEALQYNMKMAEDKARAARRAREKQRDEDMARLRDLERDLEDDAAHARKAKREELYLSKQQQRAAAQRKRREKYETEKDRSIMPDTQWKFTDNEKVAATMARQRAEQRKVLDMQRTKKQELDARLSLSARGPFHKMAQTGNRAAPKQHPVFLPGPYEPARGHIVPPEAAEAAYREAYERNERELRRKLELGRKKNAEVANHAKSLDDEYMRRKMERRRNQHNMNKTLASQVAVKKKKEELDLTALLTEPPPDHSRVHPEEAARNYKVEEQAKAALRAALDEQVRQRSKHRRKERRTQIRQDRFFIKGVNEAMTVDRKHRAQKRQDMIDSLQYEWQRQQDLTKLVKETEKRLR